VTDGFRLGIDFGTSNTAAVMRWPDGTVKALLFDGPELLPSAVCLDASSVLLAGRDALHAARGRPEGFEPNPNSASTTAPFPLPGRRSRSST
jgi:molecular chaperone DnaK (HSP70)